jgi:predicted amidohydrolase
MAYFTGCSGAVVEKQKRRREKRSVTRLGEISPFGRYYLLGAFFPEKYRQNDLCAIFFPKTPKIHLTKSYIWATFFS